MPRRLLLAALLSISPSAFAASGRLADNSLLVEEAFNQEPGTVQHIGQIQLANDGGWLFGFSQEWGINSQKHQYSYTVPLVHPDNGDTDLGDVRLDYRYQAIGGNADDPLSVSPRATLILPTGSSGKGTGNGALGYQVAVPASINFNPSLMAHVNGGLIYVPSHENPSGADHDTLAFTGGTSLVWYLLPKFNFLLELVGTREQFVTATGGAEWGSRCFVNPGIRYGVDLAEGTQLVPALSYYYGIGASHGDEGIIAYLSLEQAFR